MIRLFSQAPGNPSQGTYAYGQSILRLYSQYFLSGLIDLQLPVDEQIVLLIADGVLVGTYHVKETTADAIPLSMLSTYWGQEEINIRSLNLPRDAVRAARELLEWSPPAQLVLLESTGLTEYLELCKTHQSSGLIYLSWEELEGYILVDHGVPLPNETILTTPSDVEAGPQNFDLISRRISGMFTLRFYEIHPDTVTAQQRHLRYALTDLVNNLLPRYLKIVGAKLTSSLMTDVQNVMQTNGWHIQFSADALRDTHVFADLDTNVLAYQTLLGKLRSHLTRIIGQTLSDTIVQDALNSLQSDDQRTLKQYGLIPS